MENESTYSIKKAQYSLDIGDHMNIDNQWLINRIKILESRASQFESTLKETMNVRDQLGEENSRLKKIIAQDFNENDDLGSEFVYVTILKDEITTLNEKLKIAIEALDFYAKHHHHMNTTAPNFAREALDKLKKELNP